MNLFILHAASFQSTLPRRERRNRNPELRCQRQISIHAPAKGATIPFDVARLVGLLISIHAPAKGATNISRCTVCDWWISIHAPAKGATFQIAQKMETERDFNPRSREGSDPIVHYKVAQIVSFQSTLPRRERPTPAEERRGGLKISIHAPAKGATYRFRFAARFAAISIHAPAKGATACTRLSAG